MAFFFNRGRFWTKLIGLLWQLPLFLSVSMGLALHNAWAVWQGLMGKRTAFVRTPKFNVEIRGNAWQENSYIHYNIPWTTFLEGGLAIVFLVISGVSFYEKTFEMLPFHLMLSLGYGIVFYTSFKSTI